MKKAAALWLARALQERMSQPGRRRKARQQRAGVGQRCEQLADGSCRGGGGAGRTAARASLRQQKKREEVWATKALARLPLKHR